ncbi:unnamed protein product, partial [Ilex paraguariensis]
EMVNKRGGNGKQEDKSTEDEYPERQNENIAEPRLGGLQQLYQCLATLTTLIQTQIPGLTRNPENTLMQSEQVQGVRNVEIPPVPNII